MLLSSKGFCVDVNGVIRWGWEYSNPTAITEHLPPTRLEVGPTGIMVESLLFDPTDTLIAADSDFFPGEVTTLLRGGDTIRLRIVDSVLHVNEVVDTVTGRIERPHAIELKRQARRARRIPPEEGSFRGK